MGVQALFSEERALGRAVVDTATQNLGTKKRRVHPAEARYYVIANTTAGTLTVVLPYDLTIFPLGFFLAIENATLIGNSILVKDITEAVTLATIAVGQVTNIYLLPSGPHFITGTAGLHFFLA